MLAQQKNLNFNIQIDPTLPNALNGDEQRIDNINTQWQDLKFKHILLPIWLAAFRYRGKVYQILVNGQTGEVAGKAPWSWQKISILVASILVAVLLLYFYLRS